MKLTHYIYKGVALLLMAVMGFASQSCSEDIAERGEDIDIHPKGRISVTVATQDVKTRGLTEFEDDGANNERIHSCVVAFVKVNDNGNGTVALVKELTSETAGTGDKSIEFDAMLDEGNYKVYAFANIEKSELIGLNFTKDSNFGDIDNMVFDVEADHLTSTSKIPMSGYLYGITVAANGTVSLDGTQKTEIEIPVVRMVGKLEFVFTNTSSAASPITITEISVKPASSDAVKLLPTWDGSKLASPDMTGVTRTTSINKTFENFSIGTEENANTGSCNLYVREVVSNHETGHFPISIKYKKGDSTEETMTALLYDLTEINRNDWIRIPITLTDYKLKLDVEFYPPIGGYPAETLTEKEDEYYIKFGTGGWFALYASVVDKKTGTEIPGKNVQISIVENGVSNTGFFRIQPKVESSGELTGEINSLTQDATSIVTLQVTVSEGEKTKTFTRKIHFLYSA